MKVNIINGVTFLLISNTITTGVADCPRDCADLYSEEKKIRSIFGLELEKKFNGTTENTILPQQILENKSAIKNATHKLDFQPPFELKPAFIPSGGTELCQEHTKIYLRALKKWEKWAIQMWDATGKPGSSLYSGNVHQLGDFDSCLSIDGPKGFKTNYCLAAIDIEVEDNAPPIVREVAEKIHVDWFFKSNMHEVAHMIPRFSTFGWGICIPKSCSKDSIERGLKNALLALNKTPGLIVRTGLPKYSCHEERDPFNLPTVLTILFFVSVIITSIVGTVMDVNRDENGNNNNNNNVKGNKKDILLAFSLKRNWTDLFAECNEEFPFLHGIRAISAFTIYVLHRIMMNGAIVFSNRSTYNELSKLPFVPILRSVYKQTDMFLAISGFLTSYNLAKEILTNGHIDWQKRIITRIIRLTPPLLAVVVFTGYVMEYTGSGPQWGTIVTANSDLCKTSLWKNLLYIQNFYKFEEMCAGHTHHVGTDALLFLLAPMFVYTLYKSHSFGFILIMSGIVASAASNYQITYDYKLSAYFEFGTTVNKLHEYVNRIHTQPLNNLAAYLTGVSLGYILQRFRKNIHINNKAAVIGWIFSLIGFGWCIFSQKHLGLKGHRYDPFDAGLYAAISPFIMCLSISWVILMCSFDRGGFLKTILTSRKLLIFSRLSYSFYLTQFIAISYNIGSIKATDEMSLFDIVYVWEFVAILVMALFLTLLLDSPMQHIKNIIYEGHSTRSKTRD